jgi:hypothetical protein
MNSRLVQPRGLARWCRRRVLDIAPPRLSEASTIKPGSQCRAEHRNRSVRWRGGPRSTRPTPATAAICENIDARSDVMWTLARNVLAWCMGCAYAPVCACSRVAPSDMQRYVARPCVRTQVAREREAKSFAGIGKRPHTPPAVKSAFPIRAQGLRPECSIGYRRSFLTRRESQPLHLRQFPRVHAASDVLPRQSRFLEHLPFRSIVDRFIGLDLASEIRCISGPALH